MLVYRVVDQNGDGMYRASTMDNNDCLWHKCCDDYDDDEHHPAPSGINHKICVKFLDNHPSDFFFGFSSLDQLNHWIFEDEWKEKMHLEAGKVLVFDVKPSHCVFDEHQVAFLMEEAFCVRELSILEV